MSLAPESLLGRAPHWKRSSLPSEQHQAKPQSHEWHYGRGKRCQEEDVTEATTRDKTVKAEVTEVKEEKAAVR